MTKKAYILGVDDESANRIILEELLEDDFDFAIASSGEECIEAAKKRLPDLVLLDVCMPGIGGLETCRQLRSEPETQNTPIIFVSALASHNERLAGYEAGADDYITKPFNAKELLTKVNITLQSKQKLEELRNSNTNATSAAMTAMMNAGELGVVLQFLRASFTCESFSGLAQLMWQAAFSYELSGNLLIETADGIEYYSSDGLKKGLEEEIMLLMREKGRIIEFGSRNIYNAPNISLLIRSMPINDPEKYGRLKDHLAILIEGADAKTVNLATQQQLDKRHQALSKILQLTRDAVVDMDLHNKEQRKSNIVIMEDLLHDIEASFMNLGLTLEQEEKLLHLITDALAKSDTLFEKGFVIDAKFKEITNQMQRALE